MKDKLLRFVVLAVILAATILAVILAVANVAAEVQRLARAAGIELDQKTGQACDAMEMLAALEAAREFLPTSDVVVGYWSYKSPATRLREKSDRVDRRDAAAVKVHAVIEVCGPVLRGMK